MAAGPRGGEALAQKLNGAGFFRQRWIESDGRIGAGAPFGLIGPYIGVQSQKVLLLSQIQRGEITALSIAQEIGGRWRQRPLPFWRELCRAIGWPIALSYSQVESIKYEIETGAGAQFRGYEITSGIGFESMGRGDEPGSPSHFIGLWCICNESCQFSVVTLKHEPQDRWQLRIGHCAAAIDGGQVTGFCR